MVEKLITEKDVERVAELAKLALTKDEKKNFAKDINETLNHFDGISEVNTDEVEIFSHYDEVENNLRSDDVEAKSQAEIESIRANFPQRSDNALKVKAVL